MRKHELCNGCLLLYPTSFIHTAVGYTSLVVLTLLCLGYCRWQLRHADQL